MENLIKKLEKEGYSDVQVCDIGGPNMDFGLHTHDEHTVHLILEGELILNENGKEEILKKGDQFEIFAGTTHTAKCGPRGCKFLVGVKK